MSQLFWNSFAIAGPILLSTLVVGLAVSVFQVITQLQEMSLSYVPKLAIAVLVTVVLGSWCWEDWSISPPVCSRASRAWADDEPHCLRHHLADPAAGAAVRHRPALFADQGAMRIRVGLVLALAAAFAPLLPTDLPDSDGGFIASAAVSWCWA